MKYERGEVQFRSGTCLYDEDRSAKLTNNSIRTLRLPELELMVHYFALVFVYNMCEPSPWKRAWLEGSC
jgi:hypothetical protein